MGQAARRAGDALERFEAIAEQRGVASLEPRQVEEDPYTGLCLQGRYADLLVVGQADPDDHEEGGLLLDLPEYVVLHSARPVLLVPRQGRFERAVRLR